MSRSKSFGERIADVLIEDGLLLPNQLAEASLIQKKSGGRLLKVLTDKQFVSDQDMAFSMGRCLNTLPINLAKVRVPEEIPNIIPREMAKAHQLVPVARRQDKLFLTMASLAGNIPDVYETDALCALAPEIMKRMGDQMSGVNLGDLRSVTLSVRKRRSVSSPTRIFASPSSTPPAASRTKSAPVSVAPPRRIENVANLDGILADFLKKADADLTVVVDRGGNVMSQYGDVAVMDVAVSVLLKSIMSSGAEGFRFEAADVRAAPIFADR